MLASCRGGLDPDPSPQPVPVPEDVPTGISYQLLVYSFADSDGDGIGDFKGIESKLDYLSSLGVEAVWLSPVHPAASYHGYDVTDYYALNPEYGDEDDFRHLLEAAHARDIRIYLDYVLNHCSKFHPWFTDALADKGSRYRDYFFIYNDGTYKCVFGEWMPDFNYGPSSTCESSPAFTDLASAADKWIRMGVDGFRLDAVKHIYDNPTNSDNPTFLKKFYDHCSTTYKSVGHTGNIYMVGEHFSEASEVAPYFKGIPALFEFSFWWRLEEGISSGKGKDFAATIAGYRKSYAKVRPDFIAATKLTNHDEDRAAEQLGKDISKEKLSAAVLMTAPGEPYIYQGEELGYWGSKAGGDEYVRAPIGWNQDGKGTAKAKLGGKICAGMLTAERSVESQSKSASSLLNFYRSLGRLRKEHPSLSAGDFTARTVTNPAIAAWYRSYKAEKVLVLHNFSAEEQALSFMQDKLDKVIFSSGEIKIKDNMVSMGAYSSVVLLQ